LVCSTGEVGFIVMAALGNGTSMFSFPHIAHKTKQILFLNTFPSIF
jgi:hypothetical protein